MAFWRSVSDGFDLRRVVSSRAWPMGSATSTMSRPSRTTLVGRPGLPERDLTATEQRRVAARPEMGDGLYPQEGTIRARHLEQQAEQARFLTLVTNAVVTCATLAWRQRRPNLQSGPPDHRFPAR